ncbi:MAG: GerMN domain-containing protein [Syntrophomonadaceae bacterium]|nr:GerMN domain-containing protein [Syntrophomonadaceae bacterium]
MGRTRIVLISATIILVTIIAMCLLAGCDSKKPTSPAPSAFQGQAAQPKQERRALLLDRERNNVLVYFATKDAKNLVPVTLPINPTNRAAEIAVEKLLAGPPGPALLRKTLPEGTKIRRLYMEDSTAVIDLTGQIKNLPDRPGVELALRSLSLTLSQFPNVTEIRLLADGEQLSSLGGVDLSKPYPRPETVNLGPRPAAKTRVEVFFADQQSMYLVPLSIGVRDGSKTKELALQAAEALLAGPPANSGLIRTVWPGTKVLGLEIEGETAIIKLSKDAINYGGGATAETMLVNSLVYTLTGIQGINQVQIVINGLKLIYLPEGTDISKPIFRPDKINFIGSR